MHYNYYRDFDPAIGRYIQSDPIGLKAGLNTFLYVGAKPLTHVDPYGLVAIPVPMPPPGIGKPGSMKIPGFRWPSWISKSDLDECKDDCDAKKDRDDADCEWRYKMPGRVDRDGYRGCLQISSDKWVDCYRDCNRKCK